MALTIDEILKQPVEEAKHDLHDAADAASEPKLAEAIARAPEAERRALRKLTAKMQRAIKLCDTDQAPKGAAIALSILSENPESAIANHVMGVAMERMGRLSLALDFFERAWKLNPDNPDIYQSMAMAAWRLDMLPAAERFLRIFAQRSPNDPNGIVNLGGVLRDQGRFADAIEVIRTGIYAMPNHADLWNAMGTVLLESGDPVQAVTFYSEALRLDPKFARAWNNIAFAHELCGEVEAAIEAFEKALHKPEHRRDEMSMRHGYSLALLAAGQLEQGWTQYQVRLDADYPDATLFTFNERRWNGDDVDAVRGKRILVVGEQGLGDEVMFLNALPDLIEAVGPEGEVRIACEKRLVPLIQRSFPDLVVAPHASAQLEGRDWRVAPQAIKDHPPLDYWTPVGNLLRAFRGTTDDFPGTVGLLKPDPAAVAHWQDWLASLGDGPKVGLLWKSLKMTAKRSKYFSAFERWKPVLTTPGAVFVNMQYGETAEDIAFAEREFGVTVHTPPDLDLKQDLDGVAALGKALDLTIGPMNASINLACAAGGEAWIIAGQSRNWTLLGTGECLWYPSARVFTADGFANWTAIMKDLAGALDERVMAKEAA